MKLREDGQATIEFALTMVPFMAFTVFYLQAAFYLAYSSYAQYATFLAARSYQSAGSSPSDQRRRAIASLQSTVKTESGGDRFPFIARGEGDQDLSGIKIGMGADMRRDPEDSAHSWQEGVRYTFRGSLALGVLGVEDRKQLELTSESWLTREPTDEECWNYLSGLKTNKPVVIDNGC